MKNNNERTNMYHILQKLGNDDYFTVDKVRKSVGTLAEAVAKVKALKMLDDEEMTYIITQKVGNDE